MKEDRHSSWLQLIGSLADVWDAHGLCASLARLLSEYISSTVIVALADPVDEQQDIWISRFDHTFYQTRWHRCGVLLEHLGDLQTPTVLTLSDDDIPGFRQSELWSMAGERIAAAAMPKYPAVQNAAPYGAIFVLDPVESEGFELLHLGFIASQVAVYLDRAFLRQRTDRQEVEFGLISDISSAITATLDLQVITRIVADAARRAVASDHIAIGLVDPSGSHLTFLRSTLESELTSFPDVMVGMGKGIEGWVAKTGESAIVNEVAIDERFTPEFDAHTGYSTESVLCVPLVIEDSVIGVLEAINKARGQFDKYDLLLLQAITGPLSIALQNASLHNSVLVEKRRVETIFASMSEGLLTTEGRGMVTAANNALLKLLELRQSDLIGKNLVEVVKTEQPGLKEFIDLVALNDRPFQQLICDVEKRSGGFIPVIISGASVSYGGDVPGELVFVFSDLTQIREIERMRDDFFNNIVHELHTPLATILMYARLLLQGRASGDEEKTVRFLETIAHESNRLQMLVRQMLHLAKLQATELHKIEDTSQPNHVLDQLLPPLQERAENSGIGFVTNIQPELPKIQVDEETLYMIVKNLVENAVKFTPEGDVKISAHHDGVWIVIAVSDNGIGIPKEGLPNLFSRFYRAQTAVEKGIAGTGLGLYMVKEGLDYCGGTIDVESTPGVGTTFVVRMPVARE